ncbi:hypothetical protein [Phenylobacterium sp.]|uniref:hypothetical protein n=1 Tax=Phenylobacterium sp. TaxID=1871053 RepID=UPI002E32A9B1|nr:hypothetical protein [Phenylobacterium sp.]HEX3366682.1 hypothetical protein [Phenylobacterium sp.]
MFPTAPFRMMRLGCAIVVLICAIVLVSPLSIRQMVLPGDLTVDAITFYGVTAGAYGLLPFVRRGDIAIVAMWVVLGVGIAPCFLGQEISASHMFADMAGVLLAAGPIYIARFRQVAQGDIRLYRRRQIEAAGFIAPPVQAEPGAISVPAAS